MKKDADGDMALWRWVARTVTRLGGGDKRLARDVPPAPPSTAKKEERAVFPPPMPPSSPAAPRPAGGKPVPGFDGDTEKKLKRGHFEVEARLDLHGMTQDEALSTLRRFIDSSAAGGKRTLLVITGKGSARDGGGVLRRMLPLWLEDPALRKKVLAFSPSRPADGGSGAWYVRLRKPGG